MNPFVVAFWAVVGIAILICSLAAWMIKHSKEWM